MQLTNKNIFFLKAEWIHFFLLWGSLFSFIVGTGEGYRTCAYLNILFVVSYAVKEYRNHEIPWKKVAYIFCIPAAYMLLDVLSGNSSYHRIHVYNKIILVVFLICGWLIYLNNLNIKKLNFLLKSLLILSCLFVLIQFVAYTFIGTELVSSWRYGTFNNPHHLALYILLTTPVLISFAIHYRNEKSFFLACLLIISAWLMLKTSSRPAWLGFLVGLLVLTLFLSGKSKKIVAILTIVLPATLYAISNQFHDRVKDLILHISTEERVDIWKNSYQMLKLNSVSEWVWGHGFDSYPKGYSIFTKLSGPQYTHPHNFMLEIVYTSGFLGLLITGVLYYFLIKNLVNVCLEENNNGVLNVGKLTLASAVMLFIHIFLTLPFYSTYNFYVLAILFLITHYLMTNTNKLVCLE